MWAFLKDSITTVLHRIVGHIIMPQLQWLNENVRNFLHTVELPTQKGIHTDSSHELEMF